MFDTLIFVEYRIDILEIIEKTLRANYAKEGLSPDRLGRNTKTYRLYNDCRNHYLTIIIRDAKLEIKGSLRKWHFGKAWLLDFKYVEQFITALKKLANALGIHASDLIRMSHGRFDIGCNMIFKKGFAKEFFMMNELEYKKANYKYTEESMAFKSTLRNIVIYDKLSKESKGNRCENKIKTPAIMSRNFDVIRAEVQLKSRSAVKNDFPEILDSYDIIRNWEKIKLYAQIKIIELKFDSAKNKVAMLPKHINSTEEYSNLIFMGGIQFFGFNNILAHLNNNKLIKRQNKNKYRTRLRPLINSSFELSQSEIIFKEKVVTAFK